MNKNEIIAKDITIKTTIDEIILQKKKKEEEQEETKNGRKMYEKKTHAMKQFKKEII